MSAEPVILLLGRRDQPTDGVTDYCERLREAGARRGLAFELARVDWAEQGWGAALARLRKTAVGWRDRWVLLQFTTLAWSRRGFPLRAPSVLRMVRQLGAKPGVVFHDIAPLAGTGIVGNAREYCQRRVLHQLYALSEAAFFTVPVNKISWLPLRREKAVFIPVGANCPEPAASHRDSSTVRTVSVYSITGGSRTATEVADLAAALRRASASAGPLRVLLFGRGSKEAEQALQSALAGASVRIESLGLLPPEQISQTLSMADALLFVRGQISTRRGSAIAGIACGLPVVCYAGPETGWPITEAGIVAVPLGDREALGAALETVLLDNELRKTLADRSRVAHEKYLSWATIVERFQEELQPGSAAVSGCNGQPRPSRNTGSSTRCAGGSPMPDPLTPAPERDSMGSTQQASASSNVAAGRGRPLANLSGISNETLIGKLLRSPLRLIPRSAVVPILQGPLRGKKWIAGSSTNGCWLGSYEFEKQNALRRELKPGSVVYDIGANVGFYSLLASAIVGETGHVYSFEPSSVNLQDLKKHIRLNGVKNCTIIEAAVSSVDGQASFDSSGHRSMGHLAESGGVAVRTVTLDRLFQAGELRPPNVLKIDIEGAERDCLLGAAGVIQKFRPVIFLATHGNDAHSSCIEFLRKMGYSLAPLFEQPIESADELIARPKSSG